MSGYFGSESQKRLQEQAEASVDFINLTPGACQTGRTVGCDDPRRFGFERIEEALERDGICGFRLLTHDQVNDLRSRFASQDYRFDSWDVFLASREEALSASQTTLSRGLADGLVELDSPKEPDGDHVRQIQTLMMSAGVVPFSGSFLVGAYGPVSTISIADAQGEVVAAAHAYLPHNAHSRHHDHAWGGLVAVAESQRGRGLGNYVNARMIADIFGRTNISKIYELVSASNIPSRKMVASCGLEHQPDLICGVLTPNESHRFTR